MTLVLERMKMIKEIRNNHFEIQANTIRLLSDHTNQSQLKYRKTNDIKSKIHIEGFLVQQQCFLLASRVDKYVLNIRRSINSKFDFFSNLELIKHNQGPDYV